MQAGRRSPASLTEDDNDAEQNVDEGVVKITKVGMPTFKEDAAQVMDESKATPPAAWMQLPGASVRVTTGTVLLPQVVAAPPKLVYEKAPSCSIDPATRPVFPVPNRKLPGTQLREFPFERVDVVGEFGVHVPVEEVKVDIRRV